MKKTLRIVAFILAFALLFIAVSKYPEAGALAVAAAFALIVDIIGAV